MKRNQKHSSMISHKEIGKKQGRRQKLIFLLILVIIISQFIASRHYILNAVATYLVYQDPAQKADVIVILANWEETITRIKGGVDLYSQGLAPKIFMPRMKRMEGLEEIKMQGIDIPENRDMAISILEGLGIPRDAIETSPQEVTSTWDEADEVRTYIEKKGYKTVLLVTSPYHSRRAYLIFKDALQGAATFTSVPSPYCSYQPEGWWGREEDFKQVIMEYQKLLVYYWRKIF